MTKRKIGLVLASPPQYSETFLNSKIRGLQECGFDVTVFSGTRSSENLPFRHINHYPADGIRSLIYLPFAFFRILTKGLMPSIRYYGLERKNGNSRMNALKSIYLNSQLLSRKFDWLHYGFAALAVGRTSVASAINAKMGVSFRGYDISLYPLKHPGCYDNLWATVDKVHTISDALYEKALLLGLPPTVPVKKIQPSIDISQFPFNAQATDLKKPLQLLSVGRLTWKKGFKHSLQAIRKLIDKGISLHYTIAGTGEQFEELSFVIHQLDLGEHVTLAGKLSTAEVIARYATANIYLQPSEQEGFCNAALEAQASGLLCIVSNAEGLVENVIDKQTGWVVKRRDADMLAAKIEELMHLPKQQLREITMAARSRVEKEFNISLQKSQFSEFFNY